MIERPYYMNQLVRALGTDFIKIITGIRRCGKSTLLRMLREELSRRGVPEDHVLQVNYEQIPFQALEEPEALYAYVRERVRDGGPYYLLMDEAQELHQWAKVVNGLKATFPLDIYVTGSNSRLFSGEYLTYITGRYIEIRVFPLSLPEFMRFRGYGSGMENRAFNEMLEIGAFPAAALARDRGLTDTINSGLFDSIFARDIMLRGKIRNEGLFLKVAKFVMENIGNPLSANAIARTLKSQGSSATTDTVDSYLFQMTRAYVLYQCERYNIRGKERLRTNGKYYVADLSLRNRLIGYHTGNLGHVIENLVYLELLRRGYTVYTGLYDRLEVDFIAVKGQETAYYQVALSALSPDVLARELGPYRKIRDNYPKYLITMDTVDLSVNGFRHVNLLDFLMEGEKQG